MTWALEPLYLFSSSESEDEPYVDFSNKKKHEPNKNAKGPIVTASPLPLVSEPGSLPMPWSETPATSETALAAKLSKTTYMNPPTASSQSDHVASGSDLLDPPAASSQSDHVASESDLLYPPTASETWRHINEVIGVMTVEKQKESHSPNLSKCKHGHFVCQSAHHEGPFTILFNKQQNVRKKQNQKIKEDEGLSAIKPGHQIKSVIDSVLMPQRVHDHRCPTCKVCTECAPIENLTRKQKLDILLKRESPIITSNTQIVNDPTKLGFLKIVTRLPVTEHGGLKDRTSVIREFDKKMLKLAPDLKQSLQAELDKALASNYASKLIDLPEQLREEIMRDPRYVSTVAAFKEGGTTPARICTNFSAGKLSENDTALTGKIQINLEKTCRSFKANSHVASLDVKKFFHQVSLSTEDIARHLFIWRHNLDPANPPETYCFIRLCFGHTSSSLISEEAVRKITRFGELVCTHCAGNYSESSLLSTFNTAQLGACPGVSHHLARLVKRMYVDDLIIATSSQNNLTLLVNYATALFNLFGFAFKEANIVHQGGSTPPKPDSAFMESGSHLTPGLTTPQPYPAVPPAASESSLEDLPGQSDRVSSGSDLLDPPTASSQSDHVASGSDLPTASGQSGQVTPGTGAQPAPDPSPAPSEMVGVLGYRWAPKTDIVKIKPPTISNGKKVRGRLVASGNLTPLIKKELRCLEDMSIENVSNVFSTKEKTLRNLVQIGSSHFDPLGLCVPLVSQTRHSMSLAMRAVRAEWDQTLDKGLWDFFIRQMVELYRSTLINFQRFPPGFSTQKGKSTLVITADASVSLVLNAFLITSNQKGQCEVVHIQSKSFLANSIATIPQRELHALSLASQFCRDIVAEMASLFDSFLVCTDAKVTLFWAISQSQNPKTIFVENRIQIIKSCLQTSIDLLAEEHGLQNLSRSPKSQAGPLKNFKDVLFWVPTSKNRSDLGSKYMTYDSSCKSAPMITARDIDPSLISTSDIDWMKDIRKSISEGIILSARKIESQKQHLGEDDQTYRSGFKSQGVTKIRKLTDIVLEDESGKPKVYGVTTGSQVLAVGDLHQHGGGVDSEENPTMPTYEEDDSGSFALLALASQEETSDIKFYERVKKLHNSEAKVRIHNGNKRHELGLNHFLRLEKVLKSPVDKVLRISFLVFLFCKKMLASRGKSLILTMVGLTLTTSLLRPSNLWRLTDVIEDREGEAHGSPGTQWQYKPVTLPSFSGWESVESQYENLQNFFKGQSGTAKKDFKKFIIDAKNVSLLALVPLEDSSGCTSRAGRHPRFRRMTRDLFQALHLLVRINGSISDHVSINAGEDFPEKRAIFKNFISFLTILERIQCEHFFQGRSITSLSLLVFDKLKTVYRMLIHHDILSTYLKEALADVSWLNGQLGGRMRSPFNPTQGEDDPVQPQPEDQAANLTIVDCIKHRQEFLATYQATANFLAFKLTSEANLSYPSSYLNRIGIELKGYPGIRFLKSRLINYEGDLGIHDQNFLEFLQANGIERAPIIIGGFSSYAFAFMNLAHKGEPDYAGTVFMPRRSAIGFHLGSLRSILRVERFIHVLNAKQLMKQVRKTCLSCRKKVQQTLRRLPGKIHPDRISNLRSKDSSVQVDLVPSVRVKTHPDARPTRGGKGTHLVHIVIACDIFTKFCAFSIIPTRKSSDLAMGLSIIAHKMGKPLSNMLSDRESGIVSFLAKDMSWRSYKNGIYSHDLVIRYCPAMGSAHSRHGLIENKVKSIKAVMGSSDLSSFDVTTLHLHLEVLMQELNSIPLITKVTGASYLNSFQLRCITPNTLYNRASGPICLTSDPEELSVRKKEQLKLLDHHIWMVWALGARQQDQADVQAQNIPIGAIVVFRQDEKDFGSLKNRFSVGMVTALGQKNLDGIPRSVYVLASCRSQDQDPGEKTSTRHYVFHRRVEDIILLQSQTTDQIEKIIANEEVEFQEELSQNLSDEEEEEEEDEGVQQALAVSFKRKTCHSPSFSLLLAMNQWEVCAAQNQQDQSGSWFALFLLLAFLTLLTSLTLTRAPGRAWTTTLISVAACASQVCCWQKLTPFSEENIAAFVLKKMLRKLSSHLKEEVSQRTEDLASKFTLSSTHGLRMNYMTLFVILMICLGGVRTSTHGLPRHIPPAFVASMAKISSASDSFSRADFTNHHWKNGSPYLFICKDKGYRCEPISLDEVLQKYPSTEDGLTALQQCLVKTHYHLQQDYGSCLNLSSTVKFHGGEFQLKESFQTEQNITITLCKDKLLLSFPQNQGHFFRFQYGKGETGPETENVFSYKIFALILLSIYSLSTTYLILYVLGCRVGLELNRVWRRRILARSTKKVIWEEQSGSPSEADRKEEQDGGLKEADRKEEENIYQSMKTISSPSHIYPRLPDAVYPGANIYDRLPIHSGMPVNSQGNGSEDESIYVLASSPATHLKKYQTLHRADLGSSAEIAEVNPLITNPKRSSSLSFLTLMLLFLVTDISALSQVQNNENPGSAKEIQDKEVIHVQNGTSASIFCRSFAEYGGTIMWWAKEGPLPPDSQESNGYLIIDSVEKNLELSCKVTSGFGTFQDDFKIIITPDLPFGETPLPQYLEGYDCSSSLTRPIVRSSTSTDDCKLDDFSSYTTQPDRKFLLLGQDRTSKVKSKRCFISMEITKAICERKIVSGFVKIYQGMYDTSLAQCKQLHETGKTNLVAHRQGYIRDSRGGLPDSYDEPDQIIQAIDYPNETLGVAYTPFGTPSHFDDPLIGPLQVGQFFNKQSFLGGSGVNKSDPSTPCWGTSRSHYVGPGRGFAGYDHTIGIAEFIDQFDSKSPVVVSMFLTAMIDEEPAYVNYQHKTVKFPRLGKVETFEKPGDIISFESTDFGLTFLEVPEEKDNGYFIIKNEIKGRMFQDLSNSSSNPNVVTLDFEDKAMALHVYESFRFASKVCFKTHLEDIFVCPSFPQASMVVRSDVMQELASQRHLFLQINVSESIKFILYHICKNRKILLDMAISQFGSHGSLIWGLSRGVLQIQKGEEILVFQCPSTVVALLKAPEPHCTNQLPIIINDGSGPQKKFLSPVSRVIVDQAEVATCSNAFPVKFRISDSLSICQYQAGGGLQACESTTTLSPKQGLDDAKLKTLTREQNIGPKYELSSQISKLIINYITESNFHKSLASAISYNSFICKDRLLCPEAFYINSKTRRELDRQNLGLIGVFISNQLYQIIDIICTIWAFYSILMGCLSFLLRMKAIFSKRKYKITCCQVFIAVFVELENALNPLSLSKNKIKRHQMDLLTKIDMLTEEVRELKELSHNLAIRIHSVEGDIPPTPGFSVSTLSRGDEIKAKMATIRSPKLVSRSKLKKFVSFGRSEEVTPDLETGQALVQVEVHQAPPHLGNQRDYSEVNEYQEDVSLLVEQDERNSGGNPLKAPIHMTPSMCPKLKRAPLPPVSLSSPPPSPPPASPSSPLPSPPPSPPASAAPQLPISTRPRLMKSSPKLPIIKK